jgi:alanine racemase|tara:strand:+ start:1764 stop:2168 length:405 start_codon:yes stop_codon:yes gene_type:complete
MENEDIFRGVGIEISLPTPDSFLKIKETLTRIGISSRKEKKLYQTCHILHKQGRYAILHFKELFILDGKKNTFTEEDLARRNTIVNLLEEWELVSIVHKNSTESVLAPINQIKILSHKEKSNWTLEAKYNIGKK